MPTGTPKTTPHKKGDFLRDIQNLSRADSVSDEQVFNNPFAKTGKIKTEDPSIFPGNIGNRSRAESISDEQVFDNQFAQIGQIETGAPSIFPGNIGNRSKADSVSKKQVFDNQFANEGQTKTGAPSIFPGDIGNRSRADSVSEEQVFDNQSANEGQTKTGDLPIFAAAYEPNALRKALTSGKEGIKSLFNALPRYISARKQAQIVRKNDQLIKRTAQIADEAFGEKFKGVAISALYAMEAKRQQLCPPPSKERRLTPLEVVDPIIDAIAEHYQKFDRHLGQDRQSIESLKNLFSRSIKSRLKNCNCQRRAWGAIIRHW
ncbi:MAG: hypothetical protein EOO22_00620 [Comamonadaceae bacterium]|nr:MAG: hypothetical protein EOO22_00620 [Comamonadaceae bacterium]